MQSQLAIDGSCHQDESFEVGETLTIYQAARHSVLSFPYEKTFAVGEQKDWRKRLERVEQILKPCEGDANSQICWDVYIELLERIKEGSLKLASRAFFPNGTIDPIRATIRTKDFYRIIRERGYSPLKEQLEKDGESAPPAEIPKLSVGRPGVKETCLRIFDARRKRNEPLHKLKIREAEEIQKEWPEGKPRKPQAKTIAGYIAKIHQSALESLASESDKL